MDKIKAVGFLQNPWSPFYAGGIWPRKSWLEAFWRSRSGRRLKLMQCSEVDIYYENACPIACANPRDIMPADLKHMRKVLNEQRPDVIITFGVPAALAMNEIWDEYKLPIMCLPHPAYRVVTNELFTDAIQKIINGWEGHIRYTAVRGGGFQITLNQPNTGIKI